MPIVNEEIEEAGPIVRLMIGVGDERRQALERANFPVPSRVTVRAQVDSGSGLTVIDRTVLEALDLRPVGYRLVFTPSTGGTPARFEEFSVSLAFPHPQIETYLPQILAIGAVLEQGDEVKVLIGRDVLAHCLFIYNGPDKRFSLSF